MPGALYTPVTLTLTFDFLESISVPSWCW